MLMPRLPALWMLSAAGVAASSAGCHAFAADRFFLYNLTTATTFTGVYLAPAGSDRWGRNQALNDKDKTVDPSERLSIKDVERGRFDAKLIDQKGRTCFRHDIDLSKDTTFDIRDADLVDCH
jgi:hypothetical protein